MPLYEYYCPTCRTQFEKLRPLTAGGADSAVRCAAGHGGAQRLISMVARVGAGVAGTEAMPPSSAGGCCGGGGCSCGR